MATQQLTPEMFIDRLKKEGYRIIGRGSYSTIMSRPYARTVVKVNREMDGWPAYIKWARENNFLGTFAPKVHSLKVIDRDYYIALVEKLKPVTKKEYKNIELFSDLAEGLTWAGNINLAKKINQSLAEFAIAFHKQFKKPDLHQYNWMKTRDRIVLNDPLAAQYQRESVNVRIKSNMKQVA